MATEGDGLRDVVKSLDGLVMLAEWQLTLVKDVRDKAAALRSRRAGEADEALPPPQHP
jgi:hypothetical protein